jgi:hypothetical protein
MAKVTIEVDEEAVETLDRFIKWVYEENIREKNDSWGDDEVDIITPTRLMMFAKPIAKSFGLYPFNLKTFTPKNDGYLWIEEEFTKPLAKRMKERIR